MKTVLLVDDEAALRRLVEKTLGGGARYRVLHAADGEQAIELTKKTDVSVVLLDVHMPGLDGFQTCQAIAQLPSAHRPKIVMLTARASLADRARGLSAGADEYLSKPFSPMSLLACLDRMLAA
jgi:DNA-binding response OmpR family regulator